MSELRVGQKSHVGRSRKINQDSFAVLDATQIDEMADGLYVVADGMGGRAGGEVASKVTVQTVSKVVREALADHHSPDKNQALADALREAITSANEAVWNQSRANPELRGMGTTCVAALIRQNVAAVGNVGDSRAYLLRHGEMSQITSDHSLVHEYLLAGELSPEEARSSRYKNVITRAVGIANDVAPDVELLNLQDGDNLLLCSDGLTNMLSDTEIAKILASSATPDSACEALIDAANAKGGIDNITAVVVRHGRFAPYVLAEPEVKVEPTPGVIRDAKSRGKRSNRLVYGVLFASFLIVCTAAVLYYVNGGWPEVSIKWPDKPYKAPSPKPFPKQFEYASPRFVSMKPFFGSPLTCDSNGVLVARSTNGKLVRLSNKGEFLGDYGAALASTNSASDIYMKTDSQGNLYVSLRQKKAIRKYDSSGKRRAEIGSGKLQDPQDLAIDSAGNVYVMDAGRLKVFELHEVPDSPAAKNDAVKRSESGALHKGETDAP